jgi:hypothetical protein
MKITDKTLMVNFETEVKLGNSDAIELTLIHTAFISRDKLGGVDVDIELVEIVNVKFLGIAIEVGYKAYGKFKTQMLEFGIDVTKLVDEKDNEINGETTKTLLKLMFGDRV